ncbi:potassium channel family protein [Bacteroidota bacterium]
MNKEDLKPAYYSLGLLLFVLSIGTLGYIIIEEYEVLDAIFMTIITVATVGFREVQPLSTRGKVFTSILIVFSFGTFAYAATTFTRYIISGVFRNYFKISKVKSKIDKLTNHVIIVGYGRNGAQAVEELVDHDIPCVIIDSREDKIIEIQENPDLLFIQGDPSQDEVLEQAQVHKARSIISVLPSDEENLFVVLTVREMNPNINIISRAFNLNTIKKLKSAGADNVILPDKIAGQRMAKMVAQPDVIEFLDYILLQETKDVSLEEISCKGIAECFATNSIGDLNLRNLTSALIIGLKRSDGNYIFNPPADIYLTSSDQLFVLGKPEEIASLKQILRGKNLEQYV